MTGEKEATIDEILESDNLDFEPDDLDDDLDESDSDDDIDLSEDDDDDESDDLDSDDEDDDTDNSEKSKPDENEATAKQNEIIKKAFGEEEDPDKVQKFLKKMIGDVDINDLSERELKILKSNYHAEKLANEKSQKLTEIEKTKEQETEKSADNEIEQLDTQLKEDYKKAKEVIKTSEDKDKSILKRCYEEGTPIKWYDGEEYIISNEETYEYFKDQIVRNHTALGKDLEIEISQRQEENNKKRIEYSKEKSEKFFTDFSAKPEVVERVEKVPELKEVIEYLKINALPNEGFVNETLDKFETLINSAAKRIASKEKISSEIEADKGKASKLGKGVSQTKQSKIETLDDILNASIDDL